MQSLTEGSRTHLKLLTPKDDALSLQRSRPAALPVVRVHSDHNPTYFTRPMQCRGMELLGSIAHMSKAPVQFCLHQVSVQLWKMYDTPRVSVQKKVADLHIQLSNGSREQVRFLREASIIEGFKTKMISLRDTERLFDALELSRKKRGIEKHALKTNSDPSERMLRTEEKRAKRLGALAKSQSNAAVNPHLRRLLSTPAEVPLSLVHQPAGVGRLVVARDAEDLCAANRHDVEILENVIPRIEVTTKNSQPRAIDPQPPKTLQVSIDACGRVLEPPKGLLCTQHPIPSSPSLPTEWTSRLGSPVLESDLESLSTYSDNSQTRSCSTSAGSNSSTPERFLFFESDSDTEDEPEKASLLGENMSEAIIPQEAENTAAELNRSASEENPIQLRKKPVTLKLLHFAQATSPPRPIAKTFPLPSTPAVLVSAPLTMSSISGGDNTLSGQASGSRTQRRRREVALSSFVVKEHTADMASFSLPEGSVKFESGIGLSPHVVPVNRGRRKPRGSGGGRDKRRSTRPLPSPTLCSACLQGTKTDMGSRKDVGAFVNENRLGSSPVSVNGPTTPMETTAHQQGLIVGASEYSPLDIVHPSVASYSTTFNEIVPTFRRHSSHQSHINPPEPEKQPFSLESQFSFYGPPKLVVRNGELVPKQSMSTKGFDVQSIPKDHPIFSWSLGQPVKGAVMTKRRKRKQLVK